MVSCDITRLETKPNTNGKRGFLSIKAPVITVDGLWDIKPAAGPGLTIAQAPGSEILLKNSAFQGKQETLSVLFVWILQEETFIFRKSYT